MPALRITGMNFSSMSFCVVHKAPAITRPCPSRCLVPECMTMSAPIDAGFCKRG